jgi:hypothetical protein
VIIHNITKQLLTSEDEEDDEEEEFDASCRVFAMIDESLTICVGSDKRSHRCMLVGLTAIFIASEETIWTFATLCCTFDRTVERCMLAMIACGEGCAKS